MNVEGVVESFSDARGDGVIRSADGDSLYFHCVALVDGSRHVEVGARVRGRRRVGHLGADEVVQIERRD